MRVDQFEKLVVHGFCLCFFPALEALRHNGGDEFFIKLRATPRNAS